MLEKKIDSQMFNSIKCIHLTFEVEKFSHTPPLQKKKDNYIIGIFKNTKKTK